MTPWRQRGGEPSRGLEEGLFPLDGAGFPGYAVSRDGKFVSLRSGAPVELSLCNGRVTLWSDGERRMRTLAAGRLAASAFHGPSCGRLEYRDGDRDNLGFENLYWRDDGATSSLPDGAEPVPGFPGYFVTRKGALFSTRGRLQDGLYRPMRPTTDGAGYLRVSATNEHGAEKTLKVHRAVLETFSGPPPTRRHQTRHLDGDKTNNCLSNLAWGLPIENAGDKKRHGTTLAGALSPKAKATEETVRKIRALYATGLVSQSEIGCLFNLSKATVQRMCAGQTYSMEADDARHR